MEIALFGLEHTTTWFPKFLDTADKKINTNLDADDWVHPDNFDLEENLSFSKNNGSIVAQIKRVNREVWENVLSQIPLTVAINTSGILKDTACVDEFPTPNLAIRSLSVPIKSQDVPESEELSVVNPYQSALETYEAESNCDVLKRDSNNSEGRFNDISTCEFNRSLVLQKTIAQEKNKIGVDYRNPKNIQYAEQFEMLANTPLINNKIEKK